MKKIKITNWPQYGNISVFEGIKIEYGLDIFLFILPSTLEATGTEAHIYTFCQVLKKKEVRFEYLNENKGGNNDNS